MAPRKSILPPGYAVEPEPTPLEPQELERLTEWIVSLKDEYMLAYCLHWGLGASPAMLQQYIGKDEVIRKIGAFPNLCRRHLRKGSRTVIGFNDLHQIFTGILKTNFEILLLTPLGVSCISGSNHLHYLDSMSKLAEKHRQQEISFLNKQPSLKSERCSLPDGAEFSDFDIANLILELPEEYETIIWMYFIEQRSVIAISQELNVQRVRGIIEYCRRLISKRLGYVAFLDDDSISKVLGRL